MAGGAPVGGVCEGGVAVVPAGGFGGGVVDVGGGCVVDVGGGVVDGGGGVIVDGGVEGGGVAEGVVLVGAPGTVPVGLAVEPVVPIDDGGAAVVPIEGLDRMNCGPDVAAPAVSGCPASTPGRMQPLTVTVSVPVGLCGVGDCAAAPTPRADAAATAIMMSDLMSDLPSFELYGGFRRRKTFRLKPKATRARIFRLKPEATRNGLQGPNRDQCCAPDEVVFGGAAVEGLSFQFSSALNTMLNSP